MSAGFIPTNAMNPRPSKWDVRDLNSSRLANEPSFAFISLGSFQMG